MKSEPKHVLIVEDESALRHVLAFNLEKAGFKVKLARDPTEALRFAERRQYDLVITDHCMPYGPGTDLVGKLRQTEAHAHTPVVVWTGKAEELDGQRLRDELQARLVSKSCSMKELLEVVSESLAAAQAAE